MWSDIQKKNQEKENEKNDEIYKLAFCHLKKSNKLVKIMSAHYVRLQLGFLADTSKFCLANVR